MSKPLKIHLIHPYLGLAPACRPHLTGREFKAVDYASAVTCKHCLFLIATQHTWLKEQE
jgi:hypothetical protein